MTARKPPRCRLCGQPVAAGQSDPQGPAHLGYQRLRAAPPTRHRHARPGRPKRCSPTPRRPRAGSASPSRRPRSTGPRPRCASSALPGWRDETAGAALWAERREQLAADRQQLQPVVAMPEPVVYPPVGPRPPLMFEPEPEPEQTPELIRYRAVMAAYPRCGCGQPLLHPGSVERGRCERCTRDVRNFRTPETAPWTPEERKPLRYQTGVDALRTGLRTELPKDFGP